MSRETIAITRRFPRYAWAIVTILILCTWFLGHGILHVTFLSDDNGLILWGKHMVEEDFWSPFVAGSMDPEKPGPTYYRPLALLSHGIDYAVYGWHPPGHHVTSLALHAVCCVLVFALTRKALPSHPPTLAVVATTLFALHPIHEGAIWWIAGRMELLCAMFYLMSVLALLTYLNRKRIVYLIAATACGAAAFASKEMAYSLPVVWFAIAFACTEQPSRVGRARIALTYSSPAFGLALGFLALRLYLFDTQATTFALDVDAGHLATTVRYTLRNLLLPYHVSFREWAHERTFLFAIGFIAIAGVLAMQTKRLISRPVLFGAMWCAVTMLPLIRTMSPWTLYLPSVGYCLALAWFLYPRRGIAGMAAAWLLIAVLLSFGLQLHARKSSWQQADSVARSILNVMEETREAAPQKQPVILALPGLIDDTAVFMHYFDERVQTAFHDPTFRPLVLTHLILPKDIRTHGIEVRTIGEREWELIPANPETRFAFPAIAAFNYRFDAVQPGDIVQTPWGEFELLSPNTPDTITRIRIRLTPSTTPSIGQTLIYRSGTLVPLPG